MEEKVRSGKVKVNLETDRRTGDLLVAVRFSKDDRNFSVGKLEWYPRLSELDKLAKARALIMEKQGKKVVGSSR